MVVCQRRWIDSWRCRWSIHRWVPRNDTYASLFLSCSAFIGDVSARSLIRMFPHLLPACLLSHLGSHTEGWTRRHTSCGYSASLGRTGVERSTMQRNATENVPWFSPHFHVNYPLFSGQLSHATHPMATQWIPFHFASRSIHTAEKLFPLCFPATFQVQHHFCPSTREQSPDTLQYSNVNNIYDVRYHRYCTVPHYARVSPVTTSLFSSVVHLTSLTALVPIVQFSIL